MVRISTLPPPHAEEGRRLVWGFLGEVVHCLGFHFRSDCCDDENYEDIDDDDDDEYDGDDGNNDDDEQEEEEDGDDPDKLF